MKPLPSGMSGTLSSQVLNNDKLSWIGDQRKYQPSGEDPGFSKGGAKLTQWRRMRHLSSWTHMYGSTLLHKFFLTPPIFPSEEQKKKVLTRIMDHHLTFLQQLELLCAPSSTVTVRKKLSKFTEEHDLPLPSKNLERGAINLEGGASAPLAPP